MCQDTVIVLQARLSSTRLPGKALAVLAGETLLRHCLRRLLCARAGHVVLATTTSPEDDRLVDEAASLGVASMRGPADDVLQRFTDVAKQTGARYLVRATADNPAVDIGAPARTLRAIKAAGADYCSERGLPYGAAVECMRTEALMDAAARTTDAYEREHVTPRLRLDLDRYHVVESDAPSDVRRPDLRLTVDTSTDLALMDDVLRRAGACGVAVPLVNIIQAADKVAARERVA